MPDYDAEYKETIESSLDMLRRHLYREECMEAFEKYKDMELLGANATGAFHRGSIKATTLKHISKTIEQASYEFVERCACPCKRK